MKITDLSILFKWVSSDPDERLASGSNRGDF